MKVFVFCRAEKRHIFLASLKKSIEVLGVVLWHYEYYRYSNSNIFFDVANLWDYCQSESVFVVESDEEKEYLQKKGVKDKQIIVIFTRLPQVKYLNIFIISRWLVLKLVYDSRLKRRKSIKRFCELFIMNFLADYIVGCGRRFVTVGTGEYYNQFIEKNRNCELFAGSYRLEGEEGNQKPIYELAYEDIDNLIVVILRLNIVRKTEEILFDMGFHNHQIYVVGDTRDNADSGSAPMDVYDGRLGYTRIINGIPGYLVYENKNANQNNPNSFKIMCLGGSTSDPTTANVKSWPECLYESLSAIDKSIEIWAGGVSSYSVEQEMAKLIRDGMVIRPDLVISFSGVNNYLKYDNDFLHPTIKKYQEELIIDIFKKRKSRSNLQEGVMVNDVTFGLDNNASLAEKWVQCERVMAAVCKEFDFGFLGFLQPHNEYGGISIYEEELDEIAEFYKEASKLINPCENIYDFTNIFDGEDVFFDSCHTYERGNRIIASSMLPYVLKSMKNRENKL